MGNQSNNGRRGRNGGRMSPRGRSDGGRGDNRGGRGGQRRRRDYGRRYNSDLRQSAESGNQRERIAVESGALVLIDQFMLANPQFLEQVINLMDAPTEQRDILIANYGGYVLQIQPGTYKIDRDPFASTIVIHPEAEDIDPKSITKESVTAQGTVYVDTRCVAMIDRELLDDKALLEKYQQLWFGGQDKACRDLIRDNGGAVRYGFSRYGDELGIFRLPDSDVVCLWPSGQAQAA